jgi:hypothetical protein
MTQSTNIIITRLIKYIVAIVGNIAEGIINTNYKAIIEILIKVYLKVITKRNAIFIKS